MDEIAVSDTGPPLHLTEINQEPLLTLFRRISIPGEVRKELARIGVLDQIIAALTGRLTVGCVLPAEVEAQRAALSGFRVHHADLSVAALAARLMPHVVLTDDMELRKGLETQGHTVIGSVGVLIRAFRTARVTREELHVLLDRLFNGSTLYLSRGFRAYVADLLERHLD